MKTISDEQFRAYFLGKLAEPEADDLEMRCALSAELSERAQAVERELADDYLLGMLAPQDARLFENVYLKKRARQNRLHVAKGLWPSQSPAPRLRLFDFIIDFRGSDFLFADAETRSNRRRRRKSAESAFKSRKSGPAGGRNRKSKLRCRR
jgi:hypothetical protein